MLTNNEIDSLKVNDILILTKVWGDWRIGAKVKIEIINEPGDINILVIESAGTVGAESNRYRDRWSPGVIWMEYWSLDTKKIKRKSRIQLLDLDD